MSRIWEFLFCMELLFGTACAASRFGSYRELLRVKLIRRMKRKMVVELEDKGKKYFASGKLRKDPCSDETMEIIHPSRDTEMKQGSSEVKRSASLLPPWGTQVKMRIQPCLLFPYYHYCCYTYSHCCNHNSYD